MRFNLARIASYPTDPGGESGMPLYEYQCNTCAMRFERRQSFTDEPIRTCPECGGETRRVLFPAGIIFKGSGWYVTDSRKSTASSSESSSGSAAAANGAAAGEAKGD